MDVSKTWQSGHIFIDLGIVFHGTGAERIEARIDAKIALREMRIMAHYFNFTYFG